MNIWPWLAVAGLGALHGLNPATGWMLAAADGARARDRAQTLRALVPIGLGHAGSIGVVAAWVVLAGPSGLDRMALPAGLLLAAILAFHVTCASRRRSRATLGVAAFLASTIHGTGLMLVPSLVPLCLSGTPARELTAAGSVGLALAALAVHMAAMLAVTGLLATAACGPFAGVAAWVHRLLARRLQRQRCAASP